MNKVAKPKQPDAGELLRKGIIHRADPAQWLEDVMGMKLDDWQSECMRIKGDAKRGARIAALASRQIGKSQAMAGRLAWTAKFKKDKLGRPTTSLVAAPSEKQAVRLLGMVKEILGKAGEVLEKSSETRVVLKGGAEIVAIPVGTDAATARGFTINGGLLAIDEIGFVSNAEEIMAVLLPMVSIHRADVMVISSASFEGDYWHRLMHEENGWTKFTVLARDIPRIGSDILDDLRGSLGPAMYAREVDCIFSGKGFSPIDLEAARSAADGGDMADPEPLMRGGTGSLNAFYGKEICLSVDPAQLSDYSSFTLLRLEGIAPGGVARVRMLGSCRHQKITYDVQCTQIVNIVNAVMDAGARSCAVCIDAGGVGRALLDAVRAASPLMANAGGTSTHGGSKSFRDKQFNIIRVAKLSLIAFIDGYFATKNLVYNRDAPGADILISEVMNLRADTTANGNVVIAAAGQGNDDVLFGLAQGLYYVASPETGPPVWSSSNINYFEQLATARAPSEYEYTSEVSALEEPSDSLIPVRSAPWRYRIS